MDNATNKQLGLTNAEALQKHNEGKGNTLPQKITKSTKDIIKDNVFTLFNAFNFFIALMLILVGAYRNLLFIFIIILNITIGIFQELYAKKLVEDLSLVITPKVFIYRDGILQEHTVEQIVEQDVIELKIGDQIPVDAEVINGQIEVNEALLTGESENVVKEIGSELLSGSFIVSGKCLALVTKVGEASFAQQITKEAKKHKKVFSEFRSSMEKVTKFTSCLIIPLGIALFCEAIFLRHDTLENSVVTSAAALLGMLPKGLLLFMSLALASGVIKLSKKRVLVQEMHVLEALAHVDVLCLDKTGTITEGKMRVTEIHRLTDDVEIDEIMPEVLGALDDQNATFQAMAEKFSTSRNRATKQVITFSSSRKWSAVTFDTGVSYIIGAPERVKPSLVTHEMQQAMESGYRVLVVAQSMTELTSENLPEDDEVVAIATIVLHDPVRKNAKETLDFFAKEGVDIKIISGDHPVTVSSIAKEAGLMNSDAYIDLSTVTDEKTVKSLVHTYTVFGRVSPQQKKWLVQALQNSGRTVAMTGDGVNDVPALKAADCSIAIAEGSDAARQVAQLVLLESDFAVLPQILMEGRRVVNNVTNAASIFFVKTIYSVIVSFLCIFTNQAFPFAPIQITLIDLAIEGYPSFFMSFEANKNKVTGSFLPNVLKRSIPGAITIVIHIIVMSLIGVVGNFSTIQLVTTMYYIIGFVTILTAINVLRPFNLLKGFLAVTMTGGFYAATILFRNLLHIELLELPSLIMFGIAMITSYVLFQILTRLLNKIDLEKLPIV